MVTHACTHTHTHAHAQAHTRTRTRTHARTRTHTHTHTHTKYTGLYISHINLWSGIYYDISLAMSLYVKYILVNSFDVRCENGICNSYNMDTRDLPVI